LNQNRAPGFWFDAFSLREPGYPLRLKTLQRGLVIGGSLRSE
jgi:hypothetical protein